MTESIPEGIATTVVAAIYLIWFSGVVWLEDAPRPRFSIAYSCYEL